MLAGPRPSLPFSANRGSTEKRAVPEYGQSCLHDHTNHEEQYQTVPKAKCCVNQNRPTSPLHFYTNHEEHNQGKAKYCV